MPHEIDILVGRTEVAKSGIEGTHRTPFYAPGERQDLAFASVVAMTEFESEQVSARWMEAGYGYATLEPSTGSVGGRDIVRHDPNTL